ncbi:MAG: hypothetical protein WAO98_01695 [Alphaproteobacteria bacterium]
MRKTAVFLTYLALCLVSFSSHAESSLQWLSGYNGKKTASVVADKRFRVFLQDAVPDFLGDFGFGARGLKLGLRNALLEVLGGPSDPVFYPDKDSVTLSACRYQSCAEKGFMWIDITHQQSVFAIIHYIYQGEFFHNKPQMFLASANFKCDAYPDAAQERIKIWLMLNDLTPEAVRCLEDKTVRPLTWN